ncbi:PREDICTED: osmotin-like protein TPM-1 [Ipomoea nil]|uniref:osmotin-like protein TPM-1 n=1 Tax=Ipomoea nil TaxID=35883 RepID=UPI000901DD09|nr:PREDICTED: osmotin-like protein TPM-1 [Ipomoea nil]
MDCLTTLPLLLLLSLFTSSSAVNFEVYNNCSYTVWAAATPIGGGQRLKNGQSWNFDVPRGTKMGRIWGRRNCNFDSRGEGSDIDFDRIFPNTCETGDCGGVLQCTGLGKPPNTLVEFALNQFNNNLDFFDISNVDDFNIPMRFAPTKPDAGKCHSISCTADIVGQCPGLLRHPVGCNNPCTTFGGQEYCCTSGTCGPTDYSMFFKGLCPDAYSYPKDDATNTFTCPGGTTNYRVVFCPERIKEMRYKEMRFNNKTDYLHILLDGPWKIFDNYLVTQRWQPKFDPAKAKFSKMAVWVRFPRLSVEYFRDDIIKSVLEDVGKPLGLDQTTTAVVKGRYARVAVEVDLNKPLVSEIWVEDQIQS